MISFSEQIIQKREWAEQPSSMLRLMIRIKYTINATDFILIMGLLKASNIQYEINKELELLKLHFPYHESDHIANMAYNVLAGGTCLQDIELLRSNEAWLSALDAEVIPDPTTAGAFYVCFFRKIWEKQPQNFKESAIINIDSTISGTTGECKQGMDISYKGTWGYAPLVVFWEKTREPIYIINRSGKGAFKKLYVRDDTDFSLTINFDKWGQRCFLIFGMNARSNPAKQSNGISKSDWKVFEKQPQSIKTGPRKRPENVKSQVDKKRKFKCLETTCDHIAEFKYKPGKCWKPYRMIVLRKTINEYKGKSLPFDDIRYFFYITNDWKKSARQLVGFYRKRADHKNNIDQLKHGVCAMESPSDSLNANCWAYMIIASLVWDLKAWYGLMVSYRALGLSIIRMGFKRLIQASINIPCLILRSGKAIKYRIIGYNNQLSSMFKYFDFMRTFWVTS